MKAFTRKLCLAFVTMGMLVVTGCGPDNETEGKNASAKLGDAGKANEKAAPIQGAKPPSDNEGRTKIGPTGTMNQFKDKMKPADKPADKKP